MSSILTNNGAMVALQTLKMVNKNLGATQNAISTGKSVSNAKDNSAVWAISKVMESDVQGFKAIKDSLSLGESSVSVARNASETITDLLTQMKGKIVAAQEENVDRGKIQADVVALRDQISTVVGAAQFNGLNLVDGNTASTSFLASLDRDSVGGVTPSSINVTGQNLSTGGYAAKNVFAGSQGVSALGDVAAFSLDGGGGTADLITDEAGGAVTGPPASTAGTFAAGDQVTVNINDHSVSYTVTAEDAASTTTGDIVATALKTQIDALGISDAGGTLDVDYDSGTAGTISFTNDTNQDLVITAQYTNAGSGGLGALASIDVSTGGGANAALGTVETLIGTAIDASAAFGSVEGRISTQKDFISNLSDSLKSGIGAMVDANMEEVSARLQALQTQQQLAVQSLSIANQAPQTILSLFR
ncbi:flagellin N-terminal helical domain-containing protein [Ruegeria hyattellae]|uniref:flagellin N-terminal helical domain-containing protein n=1 Tax=Ruegeria hyattellae TaxID=3233337 RepID=UPI00355C044A